MVELIDKDINEALESELESAYEMANVSKDDTGLPYDFWIDSLGDRRKSHGPRIKVRVDGKEIPMTISDNPDIPESVRKTGVNDFPHLAEIKKYIKAYKNILIAHYHHKISDREALNLLLGFDKAKEGETKIIKLSEPK